MHIFLLHGKRDIDVQWNLDFSYSKFFKLLITLNQKSTLPQSNTVSNFTVNLKNNPNFTNQFGFPSWEVLKNLDSTFY